MEIEFWNSSLNQLIPTAQMKEYFEQHEVLEHLNIRPYQLRFWESEFDVIKPDIINDKVLYSQNNFKILLRVKRLLVDDQLTVEKAKAMLDSELKIIDEQKKLTTEVSSNSFEPMIEKQFECVEPASDPFIEENMNALFEEMSIETFNSIDEDKKSSKTESVESDAISVKKVKINALKDAIKNLKECLNRW